MTVAVEVSVSESLNLTLFRSFVVSRGSEFVATCCLLSKMAVFGLVWKASADSMEVSKETFSIEFSLDLTGMELLSIGLCSKVERRFNVSIDGNIVSSAGFEGRLEEAFGGLDGRLERTGGMFVCMACTLLRSVWSRLLSLSTMLTSNSSWDTRRCLFSWVRETLGGFSNSSK